jgi:hypothetical protein
MKIRMIAILACLALIPIYGITRTKTVDLSYTVKKPIVIKTNWGISDLLIKNCGAEFVGLESDSGNDNEPHYYSFKKIHRGDRMKRDFVLSLEDIKPGFYTLHAMACYQMWEMRVEIR